MPTSWSCVGTPLDFRLGFGRFGDAAGRPRRRRRAASAPAHVDVPTVAGDLAAILPTAGRVRRRPRRPRARGSPSCATPRTRHAPPTTPLLAADADPIKPTRVYGELRQRLDRDAVVICDGGDFASYAGKYVEVVQPGCWLDTGPYGCLGNGLGLRHRRPRGPPDVAGRACCSATARPGFSLMDVDTLVRHGLPVVMVVGNNGMWGLEKHPMQAIYGWDVACDLQPGCRYDEVVRALGGAGETVTRARRDRPGARPGLRQRRALPGQRRDRPGRRLPEVVEPGLTGTGQPVSQRAQPSGPNSSAGTPASVHTASFPSVTRRHPAGSATNTAKARSCCGAPITIDAHPPVQTGGSVPVPGGKPP